MKFEQTGYEDAGEGDAIVLLHGHPFNRSMWRTQIDFLQSDYRIVAPDLRGYGASAVIGERATMSEMAQDVKKLLDELGLEAVILGGLSMGGYVALEFYSQFPDRVSALILADTKAAADTDEARAKRIETAENALKNGMDKIADEMTEKAFAPGTLKDNAEIVAFVRQMMISTPAAGAAAGLRGMAERNDHTATLEKIAVPTLIVVGADDAITPPAESEKMHRAVKNSQLVTVENAGHLTPLEQPEEFNAALSNFLENL